MSNIFAPTLGKPSGAAHEKKAASAPDYSVSAAGLIDHILAFLLGFSGGFVLFFVFYKIVPLSAAGGVVIGIVSIFSSARAAIASRKRKLRSQFFDLLEAMSVSMRAGNPPAKAMESAKEDLSLIYAQDSDIITELSVAIGKFNNAVPLSEVFMDLANRSGLEDIKSFASIYATIEGKSSRANEIMRETQQIIADKMEIEMEIETMMTAAKSEVKIMLFMPLVVLLVIGYAGAGFMDAIYTTAVGRLVSTGGLLVFFLSFIMARKFSDIQL